VVRLVVLGVAVVLLLWLVVVPLLRWRSTHYVVTTHRLLFREGVLSHRGRDVGLSRITDVSYEQSLWGRLVGSGTVTIESAGEGGTTVLRRIPDSDGVQQVVNQLVEEDADRRARSTAGHARGWDGPPGSWTDTRTVGWDDPRTAGWDDRWDDGAGSSRWDGRWDDPADETDEAPRRRRR
jgi:hypothetical protein